MRNVRVTIGEISVEAPSPGLLDDTTLRLRIADAVSRRLAGSLDEGIPSMGQIVFEMAAAETFDTDEEVAHEVSRRVAEALGQRR